MASMAKRLIFILIITLAGILRFYRLGSVPPSLDWDEVSLGYNAWALAETGRDEFGNSWPLSIRSFGDYKPPLYTYLLIPSLKVFGRTELAIRFPSALAGTLTVLVTFFLTKELFLQKSKGNGQWSTVGLMASFLLAISPWHLQFSRIAFEANVGLFFFVTGMWLLLRSRSGWLLVLSTVSFSAAMMSYHSLRIVAPLVIFSALFIRRKSVFGKLKHQVIPVAISVIIAALTISAIFYTVVIQDVGGSRFRETSFLTIDDLLTVSQRRVERFQGNFLDRVANHRFLVYGKQYLRGYLDHFNLRFWLLDGDRIDRHRTPGVGLLYWWELPFLVVGLISLIRPIRLIKVKERNILLLWFLLAPAASALTGGTPSAVRSLVFLPTFQIMTAIGVIRVIRRIGELRMVTCLLFTVYCLLFTFEFSHYLHQYYVQAPVEYAPSWQYGYKQLVEQVKEEKDNYEKVVVTTSYDQPYIYFLWYGGYHPSEWVNNGEFNQRFDNLLFEKIDWIAWQGESRALVIGDPLEIPEAEWDFRVDFPDGTPAFVVAEAR